ncbi:MAG: type I polyketide synthase [Coleofasciculus sp. C1-SOL-03]|uniref:type I polyketide synthase n=1 Tax=Coleofasciculus sp. C1-SOL-03 TaxID=3069522 RepID=UPI0032F4ABA1
MEPIAIIGIGCRFPGAKDPTAFWQLLRDGVDAITEIPTNRWDINELYDPNPEHPGKISSRYGGFLEQVDQFDPHVFGISPREALSMDPQQRLLLEVAWEALDDAGQVREHLAGSRTGVFIGISTNDYSRIYPAYQSQPQGYDLTGNSLNIAAGRLSYLFNFRGPSMAIDTACSSSLVAVHLACQSLWNGESTLALAGGVNLILSPIGTIALTHLNALSADGRCRTFDGRANGYVRGEGAGIIVLKPLSKALADNDPIYALIRGSAVNHDGRSKGLTVPYGPAQEALIREALNKAGVAPAQISYVELHGTGTPLGDPIEAIALGTVLATDRPPGRDCAVGSVKSNIGHLEAASGIAGLIKVALSLKHQQLPPSLHFQQPNPYIPFDTLPLRVQQGLTPWTPGMGPALAGISSFGFAGTNAHLILEQAPLLSNTETPTPQFPYVLPLSAHSPEAVKSLAQSYQTLLATPDLDPTFGQNCCYTASVRRTHQEYRMAFMVHPEHDQLGMMAEIASGHKPRHRPPKLAFVFSGQGPQWWAMGRELLKSEPMVREVIEECDALIRSHTHWSLLKELQANACESRLHETEIAQPAIFALQVALARLWLSWGIEPNAVVGHSLGEVAAAHIAGILSLNDAVSLICDRGRLMQRATGKGKMAAITLSAAETQRRLQGYEDQLAIAAINGPTATVVSGEPTALESFLQALEQEQPAGFGKVLPVNYAFHSPQMAPLAAELVETLHQLQPQPETIPIVSTLTGQHRPGAEFNAEYWGRNVEQPVRFATAIEELVNAGHTVFLEISPHPVLCGYISQCLNHLGKEGKVLSSLRRNQAERATLLRSLGILYTLGFPVNWQPVYPPGCQVVRLPSYPWQRERYWVETTQPQSQTGTPSAKPVQNSKLNLLIQGETEQLIQQLQTTGQLSEHQVKLLPKLLELLVKDGNQRITPQALTDAIYAVEWLPKPLSAPRSQKTHRQSWLIFADPSGVGATLKKHLEQLGETCIIVFPGEAYVRLESGHYQLNPNHPQDFCQLLREIQLSHHPTLSAVVHLWSLPPTDEQTTLSLLQESQALNYGSVLHLVQALVKTPGLASPRLWLVTQGAQPVGSQPGLLAVAQAPVWGMGRVIALEHPELWGGLLDLDPQMTETEAAAMVFAGISHSEGEDHLAFRQGQCYVARLVRQGEPKPQPVSWQANATYLITGGLGELGLKIAQWMVAQGVRHLLLIGRRGFPHRSHWHQYSPDSDIGRRIQAIQAWEALGATVTVMAADVSNLAQMSSLFTQLRRHHPPLRGIIHAAGLLNDQPLSDMDFQTLTCVLQPKTIGTWILHQLTQEISLDFFVCFSSISALLGSKGQLHYAAANQFLDAFAHHRRALGLPALSINWGPWAGGGMADAEYQRGLSRMGLEALPPEPALETLAHLLATDVIQTTVAKVDWSRFKQIYQAKGRGSLLETLEVPLNPPSVAQSQLRQQLEAVPVSQRQERLMAHIQREVAQVLGLTPSHFPRLDQGFFEMGMDSLTSVELKHRLEKSVGESLPETLAFEYPTIKDLSEYLSQTLLGWETGATVHAPLPQDAPEPTQILAGIEQLSPEEVEALVIQELAELDALL